MKTAHTLLTGLTAGAVVLIGVLFGTPLVCGGRALPGVTVGGVAMGGSNYADVQGKVQRVEDVLAAQMVPVLLAERTSEHRAGDLGVSVDVPKTVAAVASVPWRQVLSSQAAIDPVVTIDSHALHAVIHEEYADVITLPQNATLRVTPAGSLEVIPSAGGQGIDTTTFAEDIRLRAYSEASSAPIELRLTAQPPTIHEAEVVAAQQYADQLLTEGFQLQFEEETIRIQPYTIRRLLTFMPVPDPRNGDNYILGVAFDDALLEEYLRVTVQPAINRDAVNARLDLSGGGTHPLRATQFALPHNGQQLQIQETSQRIVRAVEEGATEAALAVTVTEPDVQTVADIEALGITSLLGSGESDFAGSPNNRRHNIVVGVSRYHGVLIPPGKDFSFNTLLGPVDGAHGFKPELVIKQNVTVPEFGGGLCQVSTTAFRAALFTGLPITERRNHSYAVRYYGTPGFDATIYPGHTDLRFTNDTPGYVLIQARIEGTKVIFDFWGTKDGREVTIAGPHPYDLQPDGAVKATLKQTVTRDGQVLHDETFYSRYKSPSLFPRSQAIDKPEESA